MIKSERHTCAFTMGDKVRKHINLSELHSRHLPSLHISISSSHFSLIIYTFFGTANICLIMAPSSLYSLSWSPTEIILMILEFLSAGDLFNICLVDKRLLYIAEKALYTHIVWRRNYFVDTRLVQLIRSLLRRPQLGTYVRSMNFKAAYSWPVDERPADAVRMTKADLNELVLHIRSIDVPWARNWISELRSDRIHASIALLLTLLPNLRYLRLGQNLQRHVTHLIDLTFRSAVLREGTQNNRLSIFQNLKEVVFDYFGDATDVCSPYDGERITRLPSFYLPAVDRIEICISNSDFSVWPGGFAPSPTKIRFLDLTGLKEGQLGQILSITPTLQKLRWKRWCLHGRPEGEVVDLDQIATDLSHVKDTLIDLTIPDPCYPGSYFSERPTRLEGSFATFRCLCALKNLDVPLPFLIGFCPSEENMQPLSELLPRSIEWLTLEDEDLYRSRLGFQQLLIEWIRLWLLDWKVCTPCLRGVRLRRGVSARFRKSDFDPIVINGLEDLAAQFGIEFETVGWWSLD